MVTAPLVKATKKIIMESALTICVPHTQEALLNSHHTQPHTQPVTSPPMRSLC